MSCISRSKQNLLSHCGCFRRTISVVLFFCDFSQASDGIGSLKRSCRCDQSGSDRRPSSRCKPVTQHFIFFCGRFLGLGVFLFCARYPDVRSVSLCAALAWERPGSRLQKRGASSCQCRASSPPSSLRSPSEKKKK